jgi:hypothetical protein
MINILKVLTYISAYSGLLPFLKPKDRSLKTLIWPPKLMAGAFAPIHAVICGIGTLVGLIRRDWKLASVGLIGIGLAAKFIDEVPQSQAQFKAAFGSDWEDKIPEWLAPRMLPGRFSLPVKSNGDVQIQPNISLGQKPQGGKHLLADLWLPNPDITRSGFSSQVVFRYPHPRNGKWSVTPSIEVPKPCTTTWCGWRRRAT